MRRGQLRLARSECRKKLRKSTKKKYGKNQNTRIYIRYCKVTNPSSTPSSFWPFTCRRSCESLRLLQLTTPQLAVTTAPNSRSPITCTARKRRQRSAMQLVLITARPQRSDPSYLGAKFAQEELGCPRQCAAAAAATVLIGCRPSKHPGKTNFHYFNYALPPPSERHRRHAHRRNWFQATSLMRHTATRTLALKQKNKLQLFAMKCTNFANLVLEIITISWCSFSFAMNTNAWNRHRQENLGLGNILNGA